ncbi:MAG: hypothetical protein ABIC96_03925 [Patescibacteria group bacterium]
MAIQNDFTIYPKTKVIRHTSGTTVYTAIQFYSYLMNTFDEPGYLTYETPIKFNTPTSFTMINRWFLDNGDDSNILKYLTGGGIDTSGYATTGSDKVYMVDLTSTTDFVTSPEAGWDKDLMVYSGSNVGPLLAVKNNYPSAGLARIWVRDTQSHGAIAGSTVTEVTTAGGDGTGTSVAAGGKNGEEIYHNLFTIADFATLPEPQVYIYQSHPVNDARTRIGEWSNLSNWDRGTIDILIPVMEGGVAIDTVIPGKVSTFVRQSGDTFTFVESTLTASGRTPIATETSKDTVNITVGEHYMFYDSASDPTYTVGMVVQDVATGGATPPTWYAEVVAYTAWDASSGYITLRALRGVPVDGDAIWVAGTQRGTATVNGTVGDTYVTYDASTVAPVDGDWDLPVGGLGGTASTAERILRAYQHDAGPGKLLLQVYHTHGVTDGRTYTGTTRDYLYKAFADNDVVYKTSGGSALLSVTLDAASTTLISGFSDVTVAHMNGTIAVDTFGGGSSGVFTPGERVTWAGGGPAIMVYSDGSANMFLGNVEDETALDTDPLTITGDVSGATCVTNGVGGMTDDNLQQFNFALQSYSAEYSVFIEGGSIYYTGRSLTDIYAYLQYYLRDGQSITDRVIYTSTGSAITEVAGEEYIKAVAAYSATKSAPFGTLAGGVFFGAQGVWVQGMQSADNNKIKLTDNGGTLREPFITMDLVISNTRADDRIAVYLEDGSTTFPDKAQYTSHATSNVQSGSLFYINTGAMPNDTPTSGSLIVVATDENEEHRYRFTERNGTTNPAIFTLAAEVSGTSDGGGLEQLIDSGASFGDGTGAVRIGDIVRQTTDSGWGYVTAVTNTTTLAVTLNSEGYTWDTKGYEINSLVQAYDDSDTFFVPYMDFIEVDGTDEVPGSQTVTLTYGSTIVGAADREVIIEARNVKNSSYRIVPFKTTQQITSTGMTQSVIRTQDTVFA